MGHEEERYRVFHSQFGEDEFLATNGYLRPTGVFVDVGAGHPTTLSNSYYLERNGWTGVCVDADPRQVELLRRERRCPVELAAITASGTEARLVQCKWAEFSTTLDHLPRLVAAERRLDAGPVQTISVPALRLETVLEKHHIERFDLLSVDTEGNELDVCRSMDWERHRPSLVIVETKTWHRRPNEPEILEFFSRLRYRVIHRTACNLMLAAD